MVSKAAELRSSLEPSVTDAIRSGDERKSRSNGRA
jgi:hypothetical protein